MARRKHILSKEEKDALQAEKLEIALKVLPTPIGRALRKPGATFRYWGGSTPVNIWVQSASGRIVAHSEEGPDCPVREAFRNLRPFLKGGASTGTGERELSLDGTLAAEFERRRMDKKIRKPEPSIPKKPKSRF